MNPWLVIGFIGAGIIFLLDFILRRKKWSQNTKEEKISLVINMVFVGIYAFSSAVGMFLGIVGCSADSVIGQKIYDITLILAAAIWAISILVTIGSLILRKKGKIKASIWINIITLGYIILVVTVNGLTGLM